VLEDIIGRKIILRKPRMSDVNPMLSLVTDPHISQWLHLPPFFGERDAAHHIRIWLQDWNNEWAYHYSILRKGQFVGMIAVEPRDTPRAELGYWIGGKFSGKGFATEAALLLTSASFKKLPIRELYAQVSQENTASRRILQKIGMNVYKKETDELEYALKKSDYRKLRAV